MWGIYQLLCNWGMRSLCPSNLSLAQSSLERMKALLAPPLPMMECRIIQSYYAGNHYCYEFRDTDLNNNSVRRNKNKVYVWREMNLLRNKESKSQIQTEGEKKLRIPRIGLSFAANCIYMYQVHCITTPRTTEPMFLSAICLILQCFLNIQAQWLILFLSISWDCRWNAIAPCPGLTFFFFNCSQC